MTATITIDTNAEGNHEFDLTDVIIYGESLMDYLVYYLFDEDDGYHASLPEEERDMRELYLRESGLIIQEVNDDEGIADHFFYKDSSGITSFNLSEYTEIADLLDSPSSHYRADAVAAYLTYTHGHWSKQDFDSCYEGEFDSDEDFARSRDLPDELPDWAQPYFDWERYANDLLQDYYEQDGHYFSAY